MSEALTILLPEKVRYIIHRITQAGYEAYAVGGCVRDSVLGRKPDDLTGRGRRGNIPVVRLSA